MDVLKFLQGGNQTPNSEYNPKTKKGAIQPPTLVDYNPGTSISDRGRSHLFSRIAEQSYNLNQYDIVNMLLMMFMLILLMTQKNLIKNVLLIKVIGNKD